MIQAQLNNVVLNIDAKYLVHLSKTLKMAMLNPGTRVNPADYVNVIGEVMAIPKEICDKREYIGFTPNGIKIGDMAIFRYDVVFQFDERPDGSAHFKNLVSYNGKDYWFCDITKLFAVIRDGKIRMLNGYCMIENISKPLKLVLPSHMKRIVNASTATLTHIREPLSHLKRIDAEPGDIIYFNPAHVQEYKINKKIFGIISQHNILGKKVASYSESLEVA